MIFLVNLRVAHIFLEVLYPKPNTAFQARICQCQINRKNYCFPALLLFTHLIKLFAFSRQYESVNIHSAFIQLLLCSCAAQSVITQTIPVHLVILTETRDFTFILMTCVVFFHTAFPIVKSHSYDFDTTRGTAAPFCFLTCSNTKPMPTYSFRNENKSNAAPSTFLNLSLQCNSHYKLT